MLNQAKSPSVALPSPPREHNVLQTRSASPGDADAPQPCISLSPWPPNTAATSLKISLSYLLVGLCCAVDAPLLHVPQKYLLLPLPARERVPAVSWAPANGKRGKKITFWATLVSLRRRLWFSPQPHFPIVEKNVSFNKQRRGKVPFRWQTNT